MHCRLMGRGVYIGDQARDGVIVAMTDMRPSAYPEDPATTSRFGSVPAFVLEPALATADADALLDFAIASEAAYSDAGTISADLTVRHGRHRKARVLNQLGPFAGWSRRVLSRHCSAIALKVPKLEWIPESEEEIAASGDGGWFGRHNDNGASPVAHRRFTLVVYLNRRPQRFSGGELLVYQSPGDAPAQLIAPRHNRGVIFPSGLFHEVLPVHLDGGRFSDCRFAMTAWL
jgi:2-oxoglutarate-Fe(II)-dependent oxygenase superfamily protein